MRSLLLVLLAGPGCFYAEAGVSRRGAIRGDIAGGIALHCSGGVYRESRHRMLSAGVALDMAPDGVSAGGGEGRVAVELPAHPRLRVFGRGAVELDRRPEPPAGVMAGDVLRIQGALGIERLLMASERGGSVASVGLAVVYDHLATERLGTGDFLGLELQFLLGVDLHTPTGGSR